MSQYIFTNKSYFDLQNIWHYHRLYNFESAEKIEKLIFDKINFIVANPLASPIREDITKSKKYRFASIKNYGYFIIYESKSNPVKIIRILNSRMDLKKLIDD